MSLTECLYRWYAMDFSAFALKRGGCREEVVKQDYHLTSKQGHMTTKGIHTHTHLSGVSSTLYQQCLSFRVATVTKVNERCSLLHLVHILQGLQDDYNRQAFTVIPLLVTPFPLLPPLRQWFRPIGRPPPLAACRGD